MAQTNFTTFQLYYSTAAGHVPSATDLVDGEIALNTSDGVIYYKDPLGNIQTITGASSPGVNTFNGRFGTVTLQTLDISTALGYTPPGPTGTGASGTWGINISGNAATATSATTAASATTATSATSAGTANYATTAGAAEQLTTSNFTVVQSGSKLFFRYNGVDVASLDSSGNFNALANVGAYTAP